eukprot:5977176-Alexandrium_andersonii.AAC.1
MGTVGLTAGASKSSALSNPSPSKTPLSLSLSASARIAPPSGTQCRAAQSSYMTSGSPSRRAAGS